VGARWAARLEADYERSSKNGDTRNGLRACVGAVYRFGRSATPRAPATAP
jgi:hypothetical protein